jgi:3-oxoadipate enol-lactonase
VRLIEKGSGPPLVIVPGLQGRWRYVGPAVDELARTFRVITFDLCDEPASGLAFVDERGFDNYVDQVRTAFDRCALERATVCGISFGGLIALRFASQHGARVSGLVLASTPGPGWHLRRRHEIYTRLPYVFGPLFLAETPVRLRRELAAALPRWRSRWSFSSAQLSLLARAPVSFARMARRARLISTVDVPADCARIAVPTLVVTGEPKLDHVVPVGGSSAYGSLIHGARLAVLEQSGHLGSITRPAAFAALVRDFTIRAAREVA